MPRKHHELHPAQASLPIEPPVVYNPEGTYMDLAERAENLIIALDAVSARNQREPGFAVASTARQYNRPIRERYGNALQAVQMGAADNAEAAETTTKKYLWRASGYTALRHVKPRLLNKREIDARGRKMWGDFNATIGHTSHVKDRAKLRNQLIKTLDRFSAESIPVPEPLDVAA